MIAPPTMKKTFADYAALPESNQITELIDGEIIVTSVLDIHAAFFTRLFLFLGNLLQRGTLRAAPLGLYIDDFHNFEPDIFWINPDNPRCFLRPDNRYWEGAPDLVVEILSDSTAYRDRGTKYQTYQRLGVSEYWLADPVLRFIEVYTIQDDRFVQVGVFQTGETFHSAVLNTDVNVTPLFAY
jgi:Uma2 family endonuclease